MFKMLVRIVLAVLLIFGILWFIGTNVKEFSKDIDLKNPLEVFNINLPKLEETETTIELGESGNEENNNQETTNEQQESNNSNNSNKTENIPNSQESTEQQKEENTNITSTSTENNTKEQKTGITKEELEKLVSNIRVSSGKNTEEYNRDTFEKPTQKYTYNGQKLTRNKYAWHVSKHLVNEDPFEYNCPYTGLVINDMSTLDFDHIIALNYVWKYGETNWSEKERNRYAYDIYIGVDVLNSSNRSKSDKGPSEWLPDKNISQYCYSWLKIAEKYDIAMRDIDIQVCKLECLNDLENCQMINKVNLDIEDITQF